MSIVEKFDGRHLREGDTIYRVVGRVRGKPSVLLELDGAKAEITLEEFHYQISEGNVSEGQEPVFNDRILTEEEASEAEFREHVLRLVDRFQESGLTWRQIRKALSEELRADPRFASRASNIPAVRTIQLYRTQYARKGSLALVDNRFNSGNRTVRYDELFRKVVLDILDESYLKSDRMTMSDLEWQARNAYLREFAQRHPNSLPGPCGRKAVESIIQCHIPHSDVLKKRLGKKLARKALLQAARFQNIEHAYDRIEVDSTQADIYVVYDDKLVRPWVTLAIDAATGFIVGMVVSLDSPTSMTTATAIFEAMTGNDEAFFDRYGIKNRDRVLGYPLTVVADQGSENSGDVIDRLLSTTAIELQKNIPGHPEKKPFVERAMGTLKNFVTKLEGATQTRDISVKERYEIARSEACWTFEEFVQKIQVWRYDVYGALPRRRIQSPLKRRESPIESWRRLTAESHVPEPPSKQNLTQMFYCHVEKRILHKYGIEVGCVQYFSNELRSIKKRGQETLQVEVRVNPADIRNIVVVHPTTGKAIYVPCKDTEMPAISTIERDRIIASKKRDRDDFLSAHEVLRGLVAGKHHKPSKAATKGVKERHAAQRKRRDDEIAAQSKHASNSNDPGEAPRPSIPVGAPTRRNPIKARGHK